MDKYKVLKDNNLDLAVGEVYDEAEVDSLCSMDFSNYDDGCYLRDCIDCLVLHGVVILEEAHNEKSNNWI